MLSYGVLLLRICLTWLRNINIWWWHFRTKYADEFGICIINIHFKKIVTAKSVRFRSVTFFSVIINFLEIRFLYLGLKTNGK